jgi:2-C-methyl-D-erythritol 4-phosphate cytidylyltransferase
MNCALILSGGSGSRFGDNAMPKQYHALCGKAVISYSIEALRAASLCDEIFIVAGAAYAESLAKQYGVTCVESGTTRNRSLKNGLDYIAAHRPDCGKVFINEAARPMLTANIVDEYLGKLDAYDSVITAQHIIDSLGCNLRHETDRADYYLIQAPEAFRFRLLYEHFDPESPLSATNQQMPAGSSLYKYFNFPRNIKITFPEDLIVAEYYMRGTGSGRHADPT